MKWMRRHRALVATAAITFLLSLLVSVVLIAGAYRSERAQRQIAETERTQARTNLRLARSAVDDMYTKIATVWLAEETSPTEIQRSFLERAQGFYEQLVADARRDPSQRRDSAVAYQRIAEIQAYLQDDRAAETTWRKSLQIGEQLLSETPHDESPRLALIVNYRKLADVYQSLLEWDKAETAYADGLAHLGASAATATQRRPAAGGRRICPGSRGVGGASRRLAASRAIGSRGTRALHFLVQEPSHARGGNLAGQGQLPADADPALSRTVFRSLRAVPGCVTKVQFQSPDQLE